MRASRDCPTQSTLEAFHSNRLDARQRARIAEHVDQCSECRGFVAQFAGRSETRLGTGPPDAGGSSVVGRHSVVTSRTRADETKPYLGEPDDTVPLPEDRLGPEFLDPPVAAGSLGRVGRYDVQEVVGSGGMGIVFRAFDESLHRAVAIKVLAPELAALPKARQRFIREARAAAAINHPNVVTIHAVEEQKGLPYFVMEYVRGASLGWWIRTKPLDPVTALRISAQIASGLAAAHEQGVIHRDIKPSNIMLEDKVDRVKITDFGLARATADLSGLTSVGHAVGTPTYMSPEQVNGMPVDERTDLFSLGCVIYAMLAGESPFGAKHSLEAARKVADYVPLPLHKRNPGIPRFLSEIVVRLLEKNPADRPPSAAEVATTLNRHLATVNQARSDQLWTTLHGKAGSLRRQRLRYLFGLGLIAAAVAAIVLFASGVERDEETDGGLAGARFVVGHGENADYGTITEAIARAGPRATIELLAGVYHEALLIDDPSRLQGLTITADEEATITAPPTAEAVLRIYGCADVTIRGMTIRAEARQWPIEVRGRVPGLGIEHVRCENPPGAQYASMVFWHGAAGSAQAPAVVRDSHISSGIFGVYITGETGPASSVRLHDNVFRGEGTHLLLGSEVRDIAIRNNIFVGGTNGVNFNFTSPSSAERIDVSNNTFFQTTYGLGFINCDAEQTEVTVRNNLLVESAGIQHESLTPVEAFASAWTFSHNWWQPPPGWAGGTVEPLLERRESLEFLSRDESSDDFLRPAAASPVATSGHGGDVPLYLGAVRPSSDSS